MSREIERVSTILEYLNINKTASDCDFDDYEKYATAFYGNEVVGGILTKQLAEFNTELSASHKLNTHHLILSEKFVYKGSTDSTVLAGYDTGEKDFILSDGTISNVTLDDSIMTKGRLCIAMTPSYFFSGYIYKTKDTGLKFTYSSDKFGRYLYFADSNGNPDYIDLKNIRMGEISETNVQGDHLTYSPYFWEPFYNIDGSGNDGYTSNSDGQLKQIITEVGFNIPVFINEADAQEYVRTGKLDKCLQSVGDVDTDEDITYYMDNSIYNTAGSSKVLDSSINYKTILNNGRIALYANTEKFSKYNYELLCTSTSLKYKYEDDNQWTDYETYTSIDNTGAWTKYLDAYVKPYKGVMRTNIPKFGSRDDAEHYLDTGDLSKVLNPEDIPENLTGKPITDTTETVYRSAKSPFTRSYYFSDSGIDVFANCLNDEDLVNLLWGSKESPTLWGANPGEMIISSYWTPILMQNVTIAPYETVKIGGHNVNQHESFMASYFWGYDRLLLFNEMIMPTFNDWRDYYTNFNLYLPFYGMVTLNTQQVLGHMLSCYYVVSPAAKNLKYTLMVDNLTIGNYECTIGADFPISSLDFKGAVANMNSSAYSIAAQGASIISNTSSSIKGAVASSVGAFTGEGSVGGGVSRSGLMSMNESLSLAAAIHAHYNARHTQLAPIINGAASAVGACFMFNKAYLIIQIPEFIVPQELHSVYNYPSNIVSTIGAFNGYIECTDVILNTGATDAEKADILTALKGGVII